MPLTSPVMVYRHPWRSFMFVSALALTRFPRETQPEPHAFALPEPRFWLPLPINFDRHFVYNAPP